MVTTTQTDRGHGLLLAIAQGSINPDTRVQHGELTAEQIAAFVQALQADTLYEEVPTRVQHGAEFTPFIPSACVDGRRCEQSADVRGPNAAGGTATLVVADALVGGQFFTAGDDFVSHATRLYKALTDMGYTIGGHTADAHGAAGASGCGACDKMRDILTFLTQHADEIRLVLAELGVSVAAETQAKIVANTQTLLNGSYLAKPGTEMVQVLRDVAGDDATELLGGAHNEVAVVVNLQEGTSLNRRQVQAEFGDALQAFNLDAWALAKSAQAISLGDEASMAELVVAMLYYNVATASVLAGPSLRIVVRP